MSVRNLRIREDTAKYLRNLDPNSAFYDPKTRSMRENPTPHEDASDLVYAGDNFARINGDAVALAQTQLFAWEAYEHGSDIHPQANPSQSELLQKQFAEKAAGLKHEKRDAVLDKCGRVAARRFPPHSRNLSIVPPPLPSGTAAASTSPRPTRGSRSASRRRTPSTASTGAS